MTDAERMHQIEQAVIEAMPDLITFALVADLNDEQYGILRKTVAALLEIQKLANPKLHFLEGD